MITYTNGNATVEIQDNGTRIISFDNELKLDYPLNVDIRVSTKCSFGLNTKTGKSFCDFCHESALTNGKECDFELLKSKIIELPKGIELAIGANALTPNLASFCEWATINGYIVNLTINQGHINKYQNLLDKLIINNYIKGLGISYRNSLIDRIPHRFKTNDNTVLHVIAGIDDFNDILKNVDYKKILVLGEKDFGFNKGKVDLTTQKHKEWYWWLPKLFNKFEVVSFDNLALEQLNVKRFFNEAEWQIFNQGEHSFYIDAVNGYFHPSSRSSDRIDWNTISMKNYFKTNIN